MPIPTGCPKNRFSDESDFCPEGKPLAREIRLESLQNDSCKNETGIPEKGSLSHFFAGRAKSDFLQEARTIAGL